MAVCGGYFGKVPLLNIRIASRQMLYAEVEAIVDIDVDVNVGAHQGWGGGHGGAEPRGGGCLGRGRPGRAGVQGDRFINVLLE